MRRSSSRCFTFGHPASRTARASASTPSPCPCPQPSRSARLPALIRRKAALPVGTDTDPDRRLVPRLSRGEGTQDVRGLRYRPLFRRASAGRHSAARAAFVAANDAVVQLFDAESKAHFLQHAEILLPADRLSNSAVLRAIYENRTACGRAHAGDIQGPPRTDRMALLAAEARGRLPATAFLRVRRDRIEGEQRQAGSVARGSARARVAVRGDVGVDTA